MAPVKLIQPMGTTATLKSHEEHIACQGLAHQFHVFTVHSSSQALCWLLAIWLCSNSTPELQGSGGVVCDFYLKRDSYLEMEASTLCKGKGL